jgi:class 3 adenylate cyclase
VSTPILQMSIDRGDGELPRLFRSTDPVLIGRSSDCQVRVGSEHVLVSRYHARIVPSDVGWVVLDQSRTGTLLNGRKVKAKERVPLRQHDELKIGPLTICIQAAEHPTEATLMGTLLASEINISNVDLTRLDPKLVLDSVMDLPQRFGAALTEKDVLQCACDYLVKVLFPAVDTATVMEVSDPENPVPRILAQRSRRPEDTPLLSRRIMASLTDNEDAVIFYQQSSGGAGIAATIGVDTRSVGACLIEHGTLGSSTVIYVLGAGTIIDGQELAAGYLKLVSTLTRQHITARRRANFGKYFSPKVVQLLMQPDGRDVAEGRPQIAETTSLFFDLRGFSLSAEASADDLLPLHEHLSSVMDTVAEEVFRAEGTIIDYQGDGCFAAWGIPFEQPDHAPAAVRCALRIVERLESLETTLTSSNQSSLCGIGIASGQTLAGSVGGSAQFKYGLLGPSVNLAARLESLTKPQRLHAPILVSEAVAAALDPSETPFVRVARVQPAGMDCEIDVFEVLRPGRFDTGEERTRWEQLVTALESARTPEDVQRVRQALVEWPAEDPRTTWLRAQCDALEVGDALSDWDGVLRYAK